MAVFRDPAGAAQKVTRTASLCAAWMLVLAVACGTPPSGGARPPSTNTGSKSSPPAPDDRAARIARIEHGLVPEVRVKGESRGSSIEERLRAHHTPGVSIAILHDHRVVLAKAYGVADNATGARLTETTLMQAASISKLFTALAALREVEAGKLSLDVDVNRALRSWRVPENEFTRAAPLTLKHLLSHTGGTNVPTVSQEAQTPGLLDVLEGKSPAINRPVRVEAKPGTKFRYSGGGTSIVQQMLVDVNGHPFPGLMSEVVFSPFKLSFSTFDKPTKSERWPSIASGHDADGTVVLDNFQPCTGSGAAGLWSTPSDIASVLGEVQLGLLGRSKLVSKELASRMTTPVMSVTPDDTTATSLGTFVEKHGTGVYFGHDGLGIGFVAMARAGVANGEGAVVMANSQTGGPLLLEIFRSIAAEYAWEGWLMPPIELLRVDPKHLAALSGRYGGDKDESVIITVKGDRLEANQPFRKPLELLPVAEDVFLSREDGTKYSFAIKPAGVRSLTETPPVWPPGPPPVTRTRLPDDAPLEPLQLLESGRADEALTVGKKRLEANAKDPSVDEARLRSVGEELLDERLDATRALAVLRLNLSLHPRSAMATLNVAEALFRTDNRADAAPLYVKAKALFASDTTMSEYARAHFSWKLARLKALDSASK